MLFHLALFDLWDIIFKFSYAFRFPLKSRQSTPVVELSTS